MENMPDTLPRDLPKRVLIVDDHPNTAEMLARTLTRYLNFELDVVFANSAEEALNLDKEKPADIVITDVMMPKVSGLELTEKIRARHTEHDTIFLLMSAYNTPELHETAKAMNVRKVLVKPIPPDAICDIMEKLIGEMTDNTSDKETGEDGVSEKDMVGDESEELPAVKEPETTRSGAEFNFKEQIQNVLQSDGQMKSVLQIQNQPLSERTDAIRENLEGKKYE